MPSQMRKLMNSFEEFAEKSRKMDVIITYDIQVDISNFRKDLLDYLASVHSGITQITESTYKINEQLTLNEIEVLRTRVIEIYEENLKLIKEGKTSKGTRVFLILPAETTLNITPILIEKV